MVLAFDTHRAVKGLKDAGFEEAQAEAVVSILGEVLDGTVATKADLKDLATKGDIAEVRSDQTKLRAELAEFKVGMYRQLWVMGIGIVSLNVATVGLAVALLKLFP